ncbi:MAG: transcriptional regulator, TetR family [Actinomycetia bacterium]|nr:transcriptional regulator, TetR family [Actinomycetes bacterium]
MSEESAEGADGRALGGKGARTRRRLLEAAEQVFADLGYNDASIVKITEAAGVSQGTFYLYFGGKQEIFDVLVEDLNTRLRHVMSDASVKGVTRMEAERLGFQAFFRFTAEHPALYRIIRQAEFASPRMLRLHYERLAEGYVTGLRNASDSGEISIGDPVVTAWALMAIGEMIGLRWILWGDTAQVPPEVFRETMGVVARVLGVSWETEPEAEAETEDDRG